MILFRCLIKIQISFFLCCPLYYQSVKAQPIIPLDFNHSIGSSGDSLGQFHDPRAIAVGPTGNLYVVDSGNNRIQKFDHTGNFLKYFGGIGDGSEQFDLPLDINIGDGLNVYVTDYNNHRIHRLDRNLNAVSILSGESSFDNNQVFNFPKGILISHQGDIFIIEGENNSILKMDTFFNLISGFGSIETGEGYLSSPIQIETVGKDFLAISDQHAGHLVIFDLFGNFIRYLGSEELLQPNGLFYWREKKLLLVTDIEASRIHTFTIDKWFSEFIPIQKSVVSKWQEPADVAVFDNRLYVLDQKLNSILVYQILSNPDE